MKPTRARMVRTPISSEWSRFQIQEAGPPSLAYSCESAGDARWVIGIHSRFAFRKPAAVFLPHCLVIFPPRRICASCIPPFGGLSTDTY